MKHPTNVDTYINTQEKEAANRLLILRNMVHELVPENAESISYGMPAYKYRGKPLIYFAAYKNHIGLYATPQGHEAFAKELSNYKQGKGSVQFPLDEDLPVDLIRRIILFRKESLEKGLN